MDSAVVGRRSSTKARWPVSGMTKSEAEVKLAEILAALNSGRAIRKPKLTFAEFVDYTYLPFYRGSGGVDDG